MDPEKRLEAFEKMLAEVQKDYEIAENNRKKFIILIFILGIVLFFRYENHHLVVSCCTYQNDKITAETDGYRIVQISDLHNAKFGQNNEKLIRKIAGLEPDMIVVTGDLVDSNHTDLDVAIHFMESVTQICPVYYVTGNHEYWLDEKDRIKLYTEMEKAGVFLLQNEAVTISVSETSFSLIGLDDRSLSDGTLSSLMQDCDSDCLRVVLAHEPQYIEKYSQTGVDLVFCGHAHGGQFILPFLGAVVAPDQGLFPKYTAGEYRMGNTTMYVSRGLGNSVIPIRLFNDPEIVCVELRG